jgi:diguanylate cyclase (GGDEF)-like protein/PAS domain S-box-containing protein
VAVVDTVCNRQGPQTDDELAGDFRRLAGRSGGLLCIAGGAVDIVDALTAGAAAASVGVLVALGAVAIAAGLTMLRMPWQRWPVRALLWTALPILVLIGFRDAVDPDPYLALLFILLSATWLGTAQPRGTLLAVSPLYAVAYWWPLALAPHTRDLAHSVVYVVVGCVVAGESLGWLTTRLHAALRGLRDHEERRFQALVAASSDATVVVDPDGVLSYVSPAAVQVLRRPAGELQGGQLAAFLEQHVHPDDRAGLAASLDLLRAGDQAVETVRFRVTDPAGAMCCVEGVGRNLLGDEAVRGVLLNLRDVTERARLEQALIDQAFTDQLTGLPNRRLLGDRTDQAVTLAGRHGYTAALLLIDLDRFKEINDTLGHHYGDVLLRQVAERLRAGLRGSDTVARLGGDEFAVLLPKIATIEDAVVVTGKLRAAIEEPFLVDGLTIDVDASIGLAACPDHGGSADELLRHAEVAMYAAKAAHLDHLVYDVLLDQHSPRRLALLGQVRRAIANDELVVHYQPKADAASGRVIGLEALVRWQHPGYGLLGPDEFVPLAETTGVIRPLTGYVLRSALHTCRGWADAGHELTVAVNLSPRCLVDLALPAQVAEMLAEAGVPADRLTLEITETAIMNDPRRALEVLHQLAALGVHLSIDDFGTGYSSMAYLKDLPVRELKVDRSFVTHMCTRPSERMIVRSTVDLAHNLGLRVVAEGVEDQRTWEELTLLGCDVIQGYHLARPMSAAALEVWLVGRETRSRAEAG